MVPPIKKILKVMFFLAFSFQLSAVSCFAQPKYIRVAIIQGTDAIRLKIKGFYEIIDQKTGAVLYRGKNLNTTVTAYKGTFLLGNTKAKADKIILKSDDPQALIIDGRRFRGDIELVKKDNANLLVINDIELEDYIKGILYNEASHYWPLEALKAQAVACRTYAVYQMKENKKRDFDVTCDIYSQVYGGKASERFRTNQAAEETKGMVLTFKGEPFPAYFHSTCGGYTEDAALLWNINIAPLKGVACGFCKESPHFSWHAVLPLEEIAEKLFVSGLKLKGIKQIEILGRDASGRATDLKIRSVTKELKVSAKDLRSAIGPNTIKSTNFNVHLSGADAVFEGAGWGHGVGLCQWGAYFMAKDGRKFQEILKYYYPQTDVKAL